MSKKKSVRDIMNNGSDVQERLRVIHGKLSHIHRIANSLSRLTQLLLDDISEYRSR